MRAATVCVDYIEELELTLPKNRGHFEEYWIATSYRDAPRLEALANRYDAHLFTTDAWWRDGAAFNKWLGLELMLDAMRREGWFCLLDSDTAWPENVYVLRPEMNKLSGPLRRMLTNPDTQLPKIADASDRGWHHELPHESTWHTLPLHPNTAEIAGFSQLFHADDPVLRGRRWWHDTGFTHAGTADSLFQDLWTPQNKVRLPFEVLHIGVAGKNWCGRATQRLDGTVPTDAALRADQVVRIWRGRRGKTGNARFDHERIKR